MKIFDNGVTEEAIQGQTMFFQYVICTELEELEEFLGCFNGVQTWWGPIARKLFVEPGAARACNALEPQCEVNRYLNLDILKYVSRILPYLKSAFQFITASSVLKLHVASQVAVAKR